MGHKESDCRKKTRDNKDMKDKLKQNESTSTETTTSVAFILVANYIINTYYMSPTQGTDLFLCGSGDSSHKTHNKERLCNTMKITKTFMVGDGAVITASLQGVTMVQYVCSRFAT
jgi:hypothetical protein